MNHVEGKWEPVPKETASGNTEECDLSPQELLRSNLWDGSSKTLVMEKVFIKKYEYSILCISEMNCSLA